LLQLIFGSPHKKKRKENKSIKKYIKKIISSEKRMPERPENGQKLVEEVQKYKDENLTVYR
jgi:hypothetical protein